MLIDMKFSITPQVIDLDFEDIQVASGPTTVVPSIDLDPTLTKRGYAADAKAVGDALDGKVDAVKGKGLSTNDFTDEYKQKLDSLGEGGQPTEVPEALPNPYKLIFTGAVEAEYDGSEEVTIEIPAGGTADISKIAADKVYFTEDLITTTPIGNVVLKDGQATIKAAGKNLLEVWNSIFVKEINPTVTQPSIKATFSDAKAYEAGTEVSPTYSVSLNPGKYQYGPDTGVEATAWLVSDTVGNTAETASGSFPVVSVPDGGDYKLTVEVTYGDGAIPLTNLGNEYPDGQIKGGTKTVTSPALTGYRNSFYGTMAEKTTIDSAAIRSLAVKSGKALADGAAFEVTIPIGARRVVIAYPASLRDMTSVKDTNGMNAEISSGFTKTLVDVEGANGYTAIPYKVYTMDFAQANDVINTFAVTI